MIGWPSSANVSTCPDAQRTVLQDVWLSHPPSTAVLPPLQPAFPPPPSARRAEASHSTAGMTRASSSRPRTLGDRRAAPWRASHGRQPRDSQTGSRAKRLRQAGHVTAVLGGSAQLDPAPGSAAQRAGRQCGVTAWKTDACPRDVRPALRSATNTRVWRTMAFWGRDMGSCSLLIPGAHEAARVEQPGLPSASGGQCRAWQLRRQRPAAGRPAPGQVTRLQDTSLRFWGTRMRPARFMG